MYALFKKEVRYFFTSAIGLTIIGLFVVLNGLFLCVFKTDYNLFNAGFADLLPFFRLSSWLFVFLVPALTMRSISEEKRSGMLSLLFTKPVSTLQIVLGKYLGVLFLLFITLLPSVIFVYMLWVLGNPVGNLGIAETVGSYIALFLLIATFAAIGLWASAIGSSQMVSFVLAAFLCFFFFFGFDQLLSLLLPDATGYGLQVHFQLQQIFALVGCSLGGGIAWEMAALAPELFQHLVIVAADWKATDWIIGNCLLQEQILKNSNNPLHDARLHAMLCYRTPLSLKMKFERTTHAVSQLYNVESWLLHHGEKLHKRFSLTAYKLMNQLVKTIDISRERGSFAAAVAPITAKITIISTDSDLYFVPQENRDTVAELQELGKEVNYYEIHSVHGHDAFLIEHPQLEYFFRNIF